MSFSSTVKLACCYYNTEYVLHAVTMCQGVVYRSSEHFPGLSL